MARLPLYPVLRRLYQVAGGPALASLTDSQLLERFVASRDEAAFTALVQRHGRMV